MKKTQQGTCNIHGSAFYVPSYIFILFIQNIEQMRVRAYSLAQTHCKVKHIFYPYIFNYVYMYLQTTNICSLFHIETNIEIKAQTRKSEFNNNKAQHSTDTCNIIF